MPGPEAPYPSSGLLDAAGSRPIRRRRREFTPADRERLRLAALANRPWERSTGPRTAAGKAKMAANADSLRKGEKSVRQLRAELAEIRALTSSMLEIRKLARSRAIP